MKKCGYCSRLHPGNAVTCPCGSSTAFGPRNQTIFNLMHRTAAAEFVAGNDISTWQESPAIPGDIDFDRMASLSKFVIIKRSQATFPDADGQRNYERSLGKLRRGPYHYYDWTKTAYDQTDYLWSLIRDNLGELPPSQDFEEWNGAPSDPGTARLFFKMCIERIRYHLGGVGWDLRLRPNLLYSSPGYIEYWFSDDPWWAQNADLWLAHYYVTSPTIPLPWRSWRFWQWNDKGDGLAHGVESKQIDMDWFAGSLEDFERYALPLPGSTPPPEPPPSEVLMRSKCIQPWQYFRSDHYATSGTLIPGPGMNGYRVILRDEITEVIGLWQGSRTGGDVWYQVREQHGEVGWIAAYYGNTSYQQTVS